jgi:hypothetical protein
MAEIHSSESGLNTSNRCFQIIISPQVGWFVLLTLHPFYQIGSLFQVFFSLYFSTGWKILICSFFFTCNTLLCGQQDDDTDESTDIPGYSLYFGAINMF